MKDANLLFIISQPRSGSTLLQKIISNNKFVNTASEHWLLLPYLSALRTDIHNAVYDSVLATEVIKEFLEKFNMEKTFVEEQRKFLLALYAPLLKDDAMYVLDKTPRYYEILNELPAYFPNSKIIILVRDPFDVLQSVIETWNIKSLRGLNYYARDVLFAPLLINNFYSAQAKNQNVKLVYYEDIVSNPGEELKKIFHWLQIPFETGILDYSLNNKTSGKRGDLSGVYRYEKIMSQTEKSLNKKAYNRVWKNFITGYRFYLKEAAMDIYGRYDFNDGKPATDFNYLLKANSALKSSKQLNIRDALIFIKTKLFNRSKN